MEKLFNDLKKFKEIYEKNPDKELRCLLTYEEVILLLNYIKEGE